MMDWRHKAYLQQEHSPVPEDGIRFSEQVIREAKAQGVPVEEDPAVLRETADVDLGGQVPPQVYAVVAGVMDMIRKLEEKEEAHEGRTDNGRIQP